MSDEAKPVPPRLARWLLRAFLPAADRDDLLYELDSLHERVALRRGARRAAWWYTLQIPSFVVRLGVERARRGVRKERARGSGDGGVRGAGDFRSSALVHGVRDALRGLRRSPSWALTSILAMSIGIAGISVVFGVANWVMLRPVPGVLSPDQLITVLLGSTESETMSWPISHPDVLALRERSSAADAITGSVRQDVNFSVGGESAERMEAEIVLSNFFDVLGVRLQAGRGFIAEADVAGSGNSVVIGDRLWARRWGRDGGVLGSTVRVNGDTYTVVGVAPVSFHGEDLPGEAELWFPAGALPSLLHSPAILERRSNQVWGSLIVRPKPGVRATAISAEMNRGMESIRTERAGQPHSFMANHVVFRAFDGIGLEPMLRGSVGRTLLLLGMAALFLLLLACANVANLGLLRAASLRSAIAVRRSLGARSRRILADRLIEMCVVGLIGGLGGIGVSVLTVALLRRSGFGLLGVPLDGVTLDGRVIAFTMAAALLAGIVAGVAPALSTRGMDAAAMLRSARHGDRRSTRIRSALVVAQVAISAVLLVGAGLFAITLLNLRRVDLGVAQDGVFTFGLDPDMQGYDAQRRTLLIESLVLHLETRPDVASAGVVFAAPFDALSIPTVIKRPDTEWNTGDVMARTFQVSGGFFDAYGLELIAGRTFRADEWLRSDSADARVVILNESAARALFPDEAPASLVGRSIDSRSARGRAVSIVGVVRDARLVRPDRPPAPAYFMPWAQGYDIGRFTVAVRTSRPPLAIGPELRSFVRELDPGLPLLGAGTVHQRLDQLLAEPRLVAALAVTLAVLGVLLSALGLYGVLAWDVAQRTREIGIRSALGAVPERILGLVARSGLGLTAAGTFIGLGGALFLGRFLEARLFGVGHLDVRTYAAGVAVLIVVALVSTLSPARRALRIDPMSALRKD